MRSSSTLTGSAWSRRSATSWTTRCATARAQSVLDAVVNDGRVELHVRDEGPGLPPDFCPTPSSASARSMRRGQAAEPVSGLALASAIAEAHGDSSGCERHG